MMLVLLFTASTHAQTAQSTGSKASDPQTPMSQTAVPQATVPQPDGISEQQAPVTAPKGHVIILQRNGDGLLPVPADVSPLSTIEAKEAAPGATPDVSDIERSALTFTSYDLDARLTPASSGLAVRARLILRNDGEAPLVHVALQISSSLKWDSVTLVDGNTITRLAVPQHLLETDADHTGDAREVILTLPAPLGPGKFVTLDTFYSGTITQNSTRLERIGATHTEAAKTDWDAIGADATALRGFGDVLWYPVSAPQLFLGQGAQLFDAVAQTKSREATASVHLRLGIEYTGDPPAAAYFCGRRRAFGAVRDTVDAPVVSATGLAVADFPVSALGFRIMSLFVIPSTETTVAVAPGNGANAGNGALLAIETNDESSLPLVVANAKDASTLLADWLGPQPLSTLSIIDHAGQPFEDGPLLVAPLRSLGAAEAVPAVTHSLTHAWVQTGRPWMDEGLAQFFVLLGIERSKGRDAATVALGSLLQPLTLAEPALEAGAAGAAGQPLTSATSELYYRRKASAVWWMLRDLAGDEPLKQALQAWRVRPPSIVSGAEDAALFERVLEKTSGKDLRWFFDDWVYKDRGLPDLTLVDVTPRELPAGAGRSTGWLVAVTVRNDGGAIADVPLVIRSGSYSTTQRIRVPGFASVTTRIVAEAPPTEVVLNDLGTPEQRTSIHTRDVVVHTR